MKQYRFDYIREWVERWDPCVPRTVEQMQMLSWDILLPFITLDENCKVIVIPPRDHYQDEIEDLNEWHRQRDEYIRNLAKEYETLQNEGR